MSSSGADSKLGSAWRVARLRLVAPALLLAMIAGNSGCSLRRYAIGQVGQALAQGGGAFSQEDDLQLAGEAIPFSLKLVESLLQQAPEDPHLLLAAASGFTQYAVGWVIQPADLAERADPAAAAMERRRGARLCLRGHAYALRALEVRYPGFTAKLGSEPEAAAALAQKTEVPLLYWAAASLGSAIAATKEPDLVVRVSEVAALLDRAISLDPAWDQGSLDAFLVAFEPVRPGRSDGILRAEQAFQRVMATGSAANRAGAQVAFAEQVAVSRQDRKLFESLLHSVLGMDADAAPEHRLAVRLHQQRASWLIGMIDDLILE